MKFGESCLHIFLALSMTMTMALTAEDQPQFKSITFQTYGIQASLSAEPNDPYERFCPVAVV